ncbi:MAG: ATP-binding protein [Pseudomonadales bacterium]|nr:ATP-binding protein [Pseudomonadales bacterium]
MFPIMLGALDLSEVEKAHRRVKSLLADQSQSRKDLQFILDYSLDVILVTDEAGLLQSWSKKATESFGYTHDQVIGKMHIDELFIGFLRHGNTGDTSEFQGTMERLDGSTFLVNVRTRTVKRRRNAVYVMYVLQDLSEQEKKKKKQAELDRQLDRAKKLESLGTLAGGIAHDFNNIMTGIFGNISFAKKALDPDHRAMEFLEKAESSISRATALSGQLLTFSKGGISTTEVINLRNALEESIDFDLSDGTVSYSIEQTEELSPVAGNKNQLQRIFANLITNAIQAMPQGGNLHFTLSNAVIHDDEIPPLAAGKYVKITVRDDGIGIKPKTLEKIFDPYFTTKEVGHGLGLTTVYSIVENHGGHIDVVSAIGKGTTFTIYLPASSSTILPETSHEEKALAREAFYGRTLLMDDEKIICEIASRMLVSLGFEVDTAANGEVAIELYRQSIANRNPYKLVILDLTIPEGIGGKDVAKAILDIDPKAIMIVSSGYADDQVMANYAEYGFRAAMAKPYTTDGLERTLITVFGTEGVE